MRETYVSWVKLEAHWPADFIDVNLWLSCWVENTKMKEFWELTVFSVEAKFHTFVKLHRHNAWTRSSEDSHETTLRVSDSSQCDSSPVLLVDQIMRLFPSLRKLSITSLRLFDMLWQFAISQVGRRLDVLVFQQRGVPVHVSCNAL